MCSSAVALTYRSFCNGFNDQGAIQFRFLPSVEKSDDIGGRENSLEIKITIIAKLRD